MADRRLLAGTVGLTLILAACGGSSATTAPAASTATGTEASVTPVATVASESTAPSASDVAAAPGDSSGPDVSFTAGGASDLEAVLPDSVGGLALTKTSFDGASIAGAGLGFDAGELDPILKANGKTIADVRMAIATPTTPSATNATSIIALQVRGLDASKLAELAGIASAGAGQSTTQTIAGKEVQKFGDGKFGGATYLKDDVIYEILLADDATLAEILSKLP